MARRNPSLTIEGDVSRTSSFAPSRDIEDFPRPPTTSPPELKQRRQPGLTGCLVEKILSNPTGKKGASNQRPCKIFNTNTEENGGTTSEGSTWTPPRENVATVTDITKLPLLENKSASLEMRNKSITLTLPNGQSVALGTGPNLGLLLAVIRKESNFNPRATSLQDCKGLMQISGYVIDLYDVRDPYDPKENISAGSRYLSGLLAQFQDKQLALAAYNMGPTRLRELMSDFKVKDWSKLVKVAGLRIPYETRNFVSRVLQFESELNTLLAKFPKP